MSCLGDPPTHATPKDFGALPHESTLPRSRNSRATSPDVVAGSEAEAYGVVQQGGRSDSHRYLRATGARGERGARRRETALK